MFLRYFLARVVQKLRKTPAVCPAPCGVFRDLRGFSHDLRGFSHDLLRFPLQSPGFSPASPQIPDKFPTGSQPVSHKVSHKLSPGPTAGPAGRLPALRARTAAKVWPPYRRVRRAANDRPYGGNRRERRPRRPVPHIETEYGPSRGRPLSRVILSGAKNPHPPSPVACCPLPVALSVRGTGGRPMTALRAGKPSPLGEGGIGRPPQAR
jgi:hypothetical protein